MVPKVPFFLPYTPMVLFFGRLGLCVYVCVSGGGVGVVVIALYTILELAEMMLDI